MKFSSSNLLTKLNRPMIIEDLIAVVKNNIAVKIKKLNKVYRNLGLPVMNGNLLYSNMLEGPDQILTSSPYRLWEYSSLFDILLISDNHKSFLDIGGAGSPLPYFLAEHGFSGLAIDLQPLCVDICNYCAAVRKLELKAKVCDITKDFTNVMEQFDIVTCISVIEHLPLYARRDLLENVYRILKPNGLFYITFDYGSYKATTSYLRHKDITEERSSSISDISSLCFLILKCGFNFVGNNPSELPEEILNLKSSPGWQDFMWRNGLNTASIDAKTPWRDIVKYCVKRLFHYTRPQSCRFKEHNFFRVFLKKVEND